MQNLPLAADLLKLSEKLADGAENDQATLRRAVSTAYYAMFHYLCQTCADLFIGEQGSKAAWRQTYRALQHAFAKNACNLHDKKQGPILQKFPAEIQNFANQFYNMQLKRHNADYDPYIRVEQSAVAVDIVTVREAIEQFENTAEKDKRAFASLVLFQRRD
ncbi:hypothetical protein [Agrobacterium tumefaciens]|uniref:hypothetical protein n=1 Tax=Agrobacterium tumefaciens TaxID=358 RepID=UPI001573C651|nr:hypothetical protein [Agrobacterium tumefaciens]NTA16022.1 hypothetical protein [Agrobacterium tumefaciens]WCK69594.1 hypothetical protein G6L96_007245 [Agrobacterium tumefaciens]